MLTDLEVRTATPRSSDYKLSDGGGLHLYVTTKGAKSWRMKYRFAGKEKRLTFGLYPEISLTDARKCRDEARQQLRQHVDPAATRRKAKQEAILAASMTFKKVALAWHENEKARWSERHAADVVRSLERDVFPDLGRLPIGEIDPPTLLKTLRKMEQRGAIETAKRVRQRVSAVFVFAIAEGMGVTDPAAIVAPALKPMPKRGKQPAILELKAARELLIAAEASDASPITKLASRLIALTAVRPGIIRGAAWYELEGIDWETGAAQEPLWRIPPARMKLLLDRKDEQAFEHLVPLSNQAVAALLAVRRLTGTLEILFPSSRQSYRPMSENAIGYLYNRVGYHGRHVPHGWRATFSTIMNERAERAHRTSDRQVIDLMLAHLPKDKVEGAYNRAAFMPRRREIAQEWADLICEGLLPAGDLLWGDRR